MNCYSNSMILCPAQAFDIPAIMTIERAAFIPKIQEKQRVFEERLRLFPQGFLLLADTSEETVFRQGKALVAGYLTSELWQALPEGLSPEDSGSSSDNKSNRPGNADLSQPPAANGSALARNTTPDSNSPGVASPIVASSSPSLALEKQFALNHAVGKSLCTTGGVLYISSYAILREYRGRGLGQAFFHAALCSLCSSFSQVHTLILLVCREWEGARHIYQKEGFRPCGCLKDFFPSLHSKTADGIIMTAPAPIFREQKLTINANGVITL